MVLTIATLDSAGKVDNWILGRAHHGLRFPAESAAGSSWIVGVCLRIQSGADGDYGDVDGHDDDSDGDDVGDGDPSAIFEWTVLDWTWAVPVWTGPHLDRWQHCSAA
jgi:hypothetical protein